jgi:hypothetical protein
MNERRLRQPPSIINPNRSKRTSMDSSTPLCLFTGRVEARDGKYVVTVPEQEVELGDLEPGESYRVEVYPGVNTSGPAGSESSVTTDRDDGEVQTTQRRGKLPHPTPSAWSERAKLSRHHETASPSRTTPRLGSLRVGPPTERCSVEASKGQAFRWL